MPGSVAGIITLGLSVGSGGSCDYPSEDDVRFGVDYDFGAQTGNLTLPSPSDVLSGVTYGGNGTQFTGTLQNGIAPPNPPATTALQASPFAAIAAAIRARVATSLSVAIDFIRLVASDKYKVTETEPLFVYIQVFGPQPFTDGGAGRLGRRIYRRVRCYIYTRSGEDTYGGDEIALTGNDPSQTVSTPPVYPGQFIAEEMVYNSLDDWFPLDSDDSKLTVEPLHPVDSAGGPPERAPENDDGLIRSHLDFEVMYILAIDPTESAP